MKRLLLTLLCLSAALASLHADTSWTDGGADSSWSNPLNWSNGVPPLTSNTSNVTIGIQPTNNLIGIDTGDIPTDIESLTLASTLTGSIQFVAAGVEQLVIHSNLTNSSTFGVTFTLPVTDDDTNADTYAIGGGLLFAGGLNFGLAQINVTGSGQLMLGSGASTIVEVAGNSTAGLLGGSGIVNYNNSNLEINVLSSSITPGSSWVLFQNPTGTLASVNFIGGNFSGSLTQSPAGFWSGFVGSEWWSFDQSSGVLSMAAAPELSITTQSPLLGGTTGSNYSQSLAAANGTPSYAWALLTGSLPNGLSLSQAGVISGMPTATGTFQFSVKVTDNTSAAASKNFAITINAPLAIASSSPLQAGILGGVYSQSLSATGGVPSYSWSVNSGSVPAGTNLSASGVLSGTPTASGQFTFVAKVTDSANSSVTQSFTVSIATALQITSTSPLTGGVTEQSYSGSLAASGGYTPYTWSVSAGSPPTGVTLGADGAFSGTATAPGGFNFTARVTDHAGNVTTKPLRITILDPLAISTSSPLPNGTTGTTYSQSLNATGGSQSYTWSVNSGTLPNDVSLSSAGLLSGTPTKTGAFNFVAKVADASGLNTTQSFLITIVAPLTITTVSLPGGTESYSYSQSFAASGGVSPYSWTVSGGTLPTGLSLSSSGALTGTVTASGPFNFTVQVMDSASITTTKAFSVTVTAPRMLNGTVGALVGLIDRDPTVNSNLGGRLDLATTALGAASGKITLGSHVRNFKGTAVVGNDGLTRINVTVPNGKSPSYQLALTLDGAANSVSGTLTTGGASATLNGWRNVWNKKTNPASALAGYYSFGLDIDAGSGDPTIPQGNGFGEFTAALNGALAVTGKTADGQAFSTGGFAGPNGQIAVYQSLYKNKGSMLGTLTLTSGATAAQNVVRGASSITWLKPADTARTYAAGFGPISLSASGQYLASSASGRVVLGLPDTTKAANLLFSEGGLAAAAIDPDVNGIVYSSTHKVVMPTGANLAKATLRIQASNGLVSGKFTLVDGSLTRKVTYQGMIVRPTSGNVEAIGYFLLPQIPATGQTNSDSPILSGQIVLQQ